jgi:nucleoside-diphosphate-sugar epimerase
MRDGNQWRPFVHVKDIAKAFMTALEAEAEKVKGQVFNVGSNEQNYQILPLAELVGKSIGRPFEIEWYGSPDNRSYRVSFDKVKQSLDFKTDYTPREGAIEIFAALKNGRVTDSLKTETVEWYKHILESQALSNEVSLRGTIL